MALHKRVAHGVRCEIDSFVGDESCCVVCGTDFSTRFRLIAHLNAKRITLKGSGECCNAVFWSDPPPRITQEVLTLLHVKDREARRAAQIVYDKAGRANP
jgi:hypothetical protein